MNQKLTIEQLTKKLADLGLQATLAWVGYINNAEAARSADARRNYKTWSDLQTQIVATKKQLNYQ